MTASVDASRQHRHPLDEVRLMAFALLLAVFLASTGVLVGGAMNRPAQQETAPAADMRPAASAATASQSSIDAQPRMTQSKDDSAPAVKLTRL
ncbi:hypothetical protein [Paraburkholderia tropica]|uniref:hypothetical protein n=1 Tax=Paraburkholderia tropica TaxID=92647 RepID=UPI002AB27290|nr:hypothetical protein [Paraburkholderia tropica]